MMLKEKNGGTNTELESVPDLVTCQAPGCEGGFVDGEKCDTCEGTSLVSDGEPGSLSYQEMHTEGTFESIHEDDCDIKVRAVGWDYWDRELFENVQDKRIYALVDGCYYTTTDEGEPMCPLSRDLIIKVID